MSEDTWPPDMAASAWNDGWEQGYRAGLKAAAKEIDCGGPSVCPEMKMKDGTCIKSVSKDCPHDEAEYIRSLGGNTVESDKAKGPLKRGS